MFKESVQTGPELIYDTMTFNVSVLSLQDHADLRSHFFTVGMKLETVNLSEPFHICPASVTKVSFPPLLFTFMSSRLDEMCWRRGWSAVGRSGPRASTFSSGHALLRGSFGPWPTEPGRAHASCWGRFGSYGLSGLVALRDPEGGSGALLTVGQ